MIGGVLKIVFGRGWFSMKFQFSITICLSFFPAGWYVVTKDNSLSAVLCFCWLKADCLVAGPASYTSARTKREARNALPAPDTPYMTSQSQC